MAYDYQDEVGKEREINGASGKTVQKPYNAAILLYHI
jgi:hypothetical protein